MAAAGGSLGAEPPPVASPAPNPLPDGPETPISLEEALAIGLRDNRTIRSAYLQRISQRFDFRVGTTPFRPIIAIRASVDDVRYPGGGTPMATLSPTVSWRLPTGGAMNFSWTRSEGLGGGSASGSETTSLSVTQPLLRGAGIDVNMAPVRQARLQEEINQLQLRDTVARTVSAIIFSYRRLLRAQEQVRLAELSLRRTQNLLETNRAMIEAGRMAASDIVQAESSLANQEVALLETRQQLTSAQLDLLQLLAVDPRTNIVAADEIEVEPAVIDLDRVIALGLASRTDVRAQQNALERARIALRLARNDRLWDLTARADVSHRTIEDPALGGPLDLGTDVRVGLQLQIPLNDLTARQREIQASVSLQTQQLQYENLLQSAEISILDAVRRVEASWRQLESARRAKALSERALDVQQERLRVGRASNFEVLSLQADLQRADVQELSASIAYLDALTALDEFIGSTLDTWGIELND